MSERTSWDEYFMEIARQVASRATCDRKHVGALLVRDRIILSTGYNGSIRGMPHCDEVGHLMENGHCVATVHAEANAVLQAARTGVRIEGSALYTTASPCWPCFKLVANAGITHDTLVLSMSEEAWSDVIATNMTGVFRVTKRALAKMIRLHRGRVIMVSSVGAFIGSAGQANYAASKAGLVGMARSMARAAAPVTGARVTASAARSG